MPARNGEEGKRFREEEVGRVPVGCLQGIARVREQLDRLEVLVKKANTQRLPVFRQPMAETQFKFHVSVRNLRHALSELMAAMMPK